ncbi:Cyclic nucleotide-gated cation channel beta-1, partial [Ophiophagus hannah]
MKTRSGKPPGLLQPVAEPSRPWDGAGDVAAMGRGTFGQRRCQSQEEELHLPREAGTIQDTSPVDPGLRPRPRTHRDLAGGFPAFEGTAGGCGAACSQGRSQLQREGEEGRKGEGEKERREGERERRKEKEEKKGGKRKEGGRK